MSGQWEVVGKKKDRGSKLPVPKPNNKDVKVKKNEVATVKIEEVLPKSQVQSLYSHNKSNKENKKPQEKNKVQDKGDKKTQKKEQIQEVLKLKPPKSIESALNLIDVQEIKSIFEKSKDQYPDAPIVWLKVLVQFLNQKVPIEAHDPVFSSKPKGFPFSVVQSGIRTVIEKALKEAGKSNSQLFFDICLTSMVTDMSKGLPAMGYRFFLQYIATNEPKLVTASISKHVTLRNSYQNRPNIGLSILWAVGHVGINDLHCGVTAFQEVFLPLIDMKNYSSFVAKYLLDLISRNNNDDSLSRDEYLLILDTIYSNKKNLPSDMKRELSKQTDALKSMLFRNSKEKYHNYIDILLKKIVMNSNKSYQDCLCDVLVNIFVRDPTTLANWGKSYPKNVAASALVLAYLDTHWKSIHNRIDRSAITDLLNNFIVVNDELAMKKRKEDGLNDCIKAIKKINENMVEKKGSRSSIKTFLCLLILVIAGLVYIDIRQEGSWKASKIGMSLNYYGVHTYVSKAVCVSKKSWSWVDTRIEENFPGYQKSLSDVTAPYVQLFSDLVKIVYNGFCNVKESVVEKYPVILQTVDSYAPGLIEQSQKTVTNIYATSIFYYDRSVDYLQKEVFVGQLSPQNVQRVVIEAFNTTQQKATEYYHWIYEKVQTSIK